LFSKLFGVGKDDEDDAAENTPKVQTPAQSAARPVVAANVPLPRARPGQAAGEQPGTFSLASASSTPSQPEQQPGTFSLASASSAPAATPAEIINSRGYWQGAPTAAAEPARAQTPREAIGTNGARLAWITGPEGQPQPPRPPRDIENVATEDTTSSIAAPSVSDWASNPGQNDRVPTDLVLAYAATTPSAEPARPGPAGPMGTVRANPAFSPPPTAAAPATAAAPTTIPAATAAPNATVATRKPAPTPAARPIQRTSDPWLRGIVMTPSVQHSLSVAMLGSPDYRMLRPLMHKPRTTVAMVFSNDPTLGLIPESFTGPAVTFLPTIGVATRTAGLR
jgi:hypothetical protein